MSAAVQGARNLARARSALPTGLLARTQALFLAIALLSAVPVVAAISLRGAGEVISEAAGYAALLALAVWWTRLAALRTVTALADVGETAGLLIVLLALSDLSAGHVLLFIALAYRCLFGTGRAAVIRVALYTAALVVGHAAAGLLDEVVFLVPAVPAVATLTYTLSASIQRQERARRRERRLIAAGAALAAASTTDEACHEIARTAWALPGARARAARVEVWLAAEDRLQLAASAGRRRAKPGDVAIVDLADALRQRLHARGVASREDLRALHPTSISDLDVLAGTEDEAALLAPLVVGDRCLGLITLACGERLAEECSPALEMLAAEASLALERTRLTERLRYSEKRFRSLVLHASDGITAVDADFVITYFSPSLGRLLQRDPETMVGAALDLVLHPDDCAQVLMTLGAVRHPAVGRTEARLRRADGSYAQVEAVTNNMLADPDVGMIVLNVRDISERKALEKQLVHQAFHDPLTGLANRALFSDHAHQALARARRGATKVVVLMLDLDDFKRVNDLLGHSEGDRLLTALAERMLACVRPTDTIARLGGDEFAILIEQEDESDSGQAVAERVVEALCRPVDLDGMTAVVGGSIGIASSASGEGGLDELMRRADIAMYAAKAAGGSRAAVYEPGMQTRLVR